ncbi:histidine--tRNA ligase [Parachitinimonas caeni]|uniref:Histidine--tRNA ligase n=1 Tax=Parachitinimonas caeni TaxID=3031301 RepID=A0ABT7DTC5_9NEIS|nr:histidine--tRNA ligase [Parachitinimonas caeni]MDK2123315.1 histidine--tRNA ligase [Parachitinimonas caeni]
MNEKIERIKGFYDVLPGDSALWQRFEQTVQKVLAQYGYRSIRLPIVEMTSLYVRSVGEHTDIVEKEMYSWIDALNGDHLTLRPEGTAGCVRSVVEHNLTYNGPQRLWYMGPMFRHEKPQKGRQRQFSQVGVEAFGFQGPDIDAELIILLARLWKELGIADVSLQLNTIGNAEERAKYRQSLIDYFSRHPALLDEDSRRRLHSNPMRILDSKNPAMQELIMCAPKLSDVLGEDSRLHFEGLCKLLQLAGVDYQLNHRLVRGLDYYNRTVFEWVTTKLGSQGTIAGGGRYDGLMETLGGKPTTACGFGLGIERVILLMQEYGLVGNDAPDVYLAFSGERAAHIAPLVAERLRDSGRSVVLHAGGGSFKSQMKRADASGAQFAVIIGDMEANANAVNLKALRFEMEQRLVSISDLPDILRKEISSRVN